MKKFLLLLIIVFAATHQLYSQVYRNEWIDHSKTYYKFKLHLGFDNVGNPVRRGWVRIDKATLDAASLGSVPAEQFQLWRDGQEVTLYTSVETGVMGSGDYIEFWGEINNGKLDNDLYRDPEFQLSDIWSLQTDTAAYFLTVNPTGSNKRFVTTANNVTGTTLDPTMYYMATWEYTHRAGVNPGFAAQAAQPLYSSSYDRGEGFTTRSIRPENSSCGQYSLTLPSFGTLQPYLNGPANMTLRINAVGNANNARTVLVKMNGDTVSHFQMDYFYDAKVEELVPVSKIAGGTFSLEYNDESPVDCDEFKLAKTQLIYPHSLDVNGASQLALTLPISYTGHYLKFYNVNYTTVPPVLYDLTNGKRYVGDISVADTVQFVTDGLLTASDFVLISPETVTTTTVSGLVTRNFVDYSNINNQGNYIIISNPLLYGTSAADNYVEQYRAYRNSDKGGSYISQVVDINDITDQFAWGIKKHPLSIRNFLRYARANFANPPLFVFLIGKGVNYIDYRQNEDQPDAETLNLVPTWGHPASDNLLSAEDNSSAVPQTPIGRLSAVTPDEVGAYLQKVMQYDSLQNDTIHTVESRSWMKNVLQIAGTNDYSISLQLDAYLDRYKTTLQDSAFGAHVKNYNKIDDPSGYTQSVKDFTNTYESGASIVTYFGHSSATNLDFSLDNPDKYNNAYRYPFFIVNGCDAGSFFNYDPVRFSIKSTISEKFILEPQRGAIGYLATTGFGVVNYLDSFTRKFMKAIALTQYSHSTGEIVKAGIADALNSTGLLDFYARIHSEQYNLHGDPAVKITVTTKPDYIIEQPQIIVSPSFISVADDSFHIKLRVYNAGTKNNDSVSVTLKRQYPNGTFADPIVRKLKAIATVDSLTLALPIVSNRDKGINTLTVVIDEENAIDEITKENNTATTTVLILDEEIRPVYPYNYQIVNNAGFKFSASTANPMDSSKTYVIEVDTTTFFNSPLKYTATQTSKGGVVTFNNGMTLQDSTTYYWRVARQEPTPHWNAYSFTYKNAAITGFEQRDFYQHTESDYNRILLDSSSRSYMYDKKVNNLFMLHSIYPTSGTEDQQFSIQVNGSGIIASACLGASVIVNVFDTLTFKPWKNETNPFGAEPTCETTRQYNFEYYYINSDGRDSAMKFINSIPDGLYVAVRLIYDGDEVFADEWMNDTTINGSGISLYHTLKAQGLPIDSFNSPRTFGFIFKKNDAAHFTPQYAFSQGLFDRITMSVDCITNDTLGYITSPKFGRSKQWKRAKWQGAGNPNNFEWVSLIGVNTSGGETTLMTFDSTQKDVDISAISTQQYPFLKLQMKNQDSVTAQPYQLKHWSVESDLVPDGAIAPNLFLSIPDTAGIASALASDTLSVAVAFKNVSEVNLDSLDVKVVLYSFHGTSDTISLPKLKPIVAGDTVIINAAINITGKPEGLYNMLLLVNPNGAVPEQFSFNNFLYKYVYLKTDIVFPVQLLDFAAKANRNTVLTTWKVTNEINFKQYEVQHGTNGTEFKKIGAVEARGIGNGTGDYNFTHTNPVIGKNYYRLRLINADGSYTYSPVRMVVFNPEASVNVYPNPVKEQLHVQVFTNVPGRKFTARLLTAFGQQLYTGTFSGSLDINMKSLPQGTYILLVDDGLSIQTMKVQKL